MSELLCVTNRSLCRGSFPERLAALAAARPAGIILREKDLPEADYRRLAEQALRICAGEGVPCLLHSFVDTAIGLRAEGIHLPLPVLRGMNQAQKAYFSAIGASCHSVEEAQEAERLGATYLTAGHVFDTDCKKGLPGRGLTFLREVCASVALPVYAIGGISPARISAVRRAGAAGACVMSGAMTCDDVMQYFSEFEKAGREYEI